MKLLKTFAGALALISSLSFATLPPMPEHCPDATALQSAELNYAVEKFGQYITIGQGNYDTQDDWALAIANVHADSTDEALAKANQAVKDIAGNPTPMPVPMANVWACLYHLEGGLLPVAISPLPTTGVIKTVIDTFN